MNGEKHVIIRIALVVLMTFAFSAMAFGSAWAERLAVDASVANVRSGPNTEDPVLWKVEQYTPIEMLETDKTGKWYYFKDYEGDNAWIHKSLVSTMETVITKKGMVNVRSGPGTKHEIVFQAAKGVPFKVLERKGNWIHIEHADGDVGWIYKNLVW